MQAKYHYAVLIHEQAKKYGTKPVITFRNFGSLEWKSVSWNQFSMRVKQVSNALINLGLKPQERIAVFAQNCIHRFWGVRCSCHHHSVLRIKFRAANTIHDTRRQHSLRLCRRTGTV